MSGFFGGETVSGADSGHGEESTTTTTTARAFRPGRRIDIPSLPDLRDIGGYATVAGGPVRTGQLYRSIELNHLRGEDLDRFAELGIRAVFDLRTAAERAAEPDVRAGRHGAGRVRRAEGFAGCGARQLLKVLSDPALAEQMLGDGKAVRLFECGYRETVSLPSAPSAYRQFFGWIAQDAHRPALFHCTTGKDRTGSAAASGRLTRRAPGCCLCRMGAVGRVAAWAARPRRDSLLACANEAEHDAEAIEAGGRGHWRDRSLAPTARGRCGGKAVGEDTVMTHRRVADMNGRRKEEHHVRTGGSVRRYRRGSCARPGGTEAAGRTDPGGLAWGAVAHGRRRSAPAVITLFDSHEEIEAAESLFERMGDEFPEELRGRRVSRDYHEVASSVVAVVGKLR